METCFTIGPVKKNTTKSSFQTWNYQLAFILKPITSYQYSANYGAK